MSPEMRVLVIDDEQAIRKFLRISLDQAGFEVLESTSGQEGITATATFNPTIILLDLGLPDMDGLLVITRIREWSLVPIIVLSARGQEQDKVKALDLGANDYLTKPFGVPELLARLRVCLRLTVFSETNKKIFEFAHLKVDFVARQITAGGEPIHLTPIEYKLLCLLIQNAGKVLTHRQILKAVWGEAYQDQSQYLRVFVNQLRQKIELDHSRPKLILTEPGVGYRLKSQD